MSAPRFRNGTFKRTLKRVPGGRKVEHYKYIYKINHPKCMRLFFTFRK